METTAHPLGKWRLRRLPCSFVTMSDGNGRGSVGASAALLYLPGPRARREVLFLHAERVNRFYFFPVN